jgi:hypothetical protein
MQLPPADDMVVIASARKIAPHIVNHPRLGSINLHASILPKYRGAAPINWGDHPRRRGKRELGHPIGVEDGCRRGPRAIAGSDRRAGKTAGELHDRLAEDRRDDRPARSRNS